MSQADALESFRIMSQNYRGQALAGLITQITQHPRVFQFTEILQSPNIINLQSGEFEKYHKLLTTFAYGNYNSWLQNKAQLPEIVQEHIRKLRQLSIIDLCSQTKVISYELLKIDLGINSDQELDNLLIDSIYEGIISGKINQAERVFKVNSCISRDIKEGDVSQIKQMLNQIYQKNKGVQRTLEERIRSINKKKQEESDLTNQYKAEQLQARFQGENMGVQQKK